MLANTPPADPKLVERIVEGITTTDGAYCVRAASQPQAIELHRALLEHTIDRAFDVQHLPDMCDDKATLEAVFLIIRELHYAEEEGWTSCDPPTEVHLDLPEGEGDDPIQ